MAKVLEMSGRHRLCRACAVGADAPMLKASRTNRERGVLWPEREKLLRSV
jgi:hypothetical protein